MNDIMMAEYIYLLQEREFIKTKEYVYKVGMTTKKNHERFNKYPKGSVLLFQMICNNSKNTEKLVIKKFKDTFKQRQDIGNEYFEGESKVMIDIIYLTIKDELNIHEEIINDDDTYQERENKIKFNLLCKKIYKIFHDCKKDESIGGNNNYDYKTFLRKYIPYNIRWDINNNYYILNRDYEYIGLNTKSIDYKINGQTYLFDDANKPWDNMNNYIRFCNEYKKIINDNSLKECLNMHNSTAIILTLD
jgi:hypothetical protein